MALGLRACRVLLVKNNRGRVRSEGLSKRDAVAALAAAGI